MQDTIHTRENEISRVRDEIYLLRQKVASKKAELSSKRRSLEDLKANQTRLEDDLAEVKRLLADEKASDDDAKNDHDSVENQVSRLNSEIKASRDRISKLEADIAASRRAQQDADSAGAATVREINDIDDKTYFLTDKRDIYNAEIDRLHGKVTNLKDLVLRYKSDRSDFEKARAADDARISSLHDQISAMESNINVDMKTIDDLEAEKGEVSQSISYVNAKISTNQSHLDDLRSQYNILIQDNDALRHDVDMLPSYLRTSHIVEDRGDAEKSGDEGNTKQMSEKTKQNIRNMFGR